jgi:hypothetical protein
MSDDGHRTFFGGFDGPYWEKKRKREEILERFPWAEDDTVEIPVEVDISVCPDCGGHVGSSGCINHGG